LTRSGRNWRRTW